jgi:hypothetical protein
MIPRTCLLIPHKFLSTVGSDFLRWPVLDTPFPASESVAMTVTIQLLRRVRRLS